MEKYTILKFAMERAIAEGFTVLQKKIDGFSCRKGNIVVIASADIEGDGNQWMHVSISRPNKYPSHDELKHVKEIFVGNDRKAIQIFPPEKNYVNIHPYCFHLWCCLTGDVIPDFDRGLGTI